MAAQEIGPEVGVPDEQPYDASDETQVNNKRRTAGRKKAAERTFLKRLLSEPAGRNWMWGLLAFCNAFDNTYIPGDTNANFFAMGQRNVGTKLIADISAVDPNAFARMLKERGNG
jgi:hypothetical protein